MAQKDRTALTSTELAHDSGDERIEAIADINALIVWRAAPDGTPLQACAVSDALPADAAHSSEAWLEAVHPDDRERVRPLWREAIRSGSVFQAFYRLRQPDGTFRWSHGCGVPLTAADGSVREWIGTIADIEDRIAAERSRHDARLRQALASTRVGVWDIDLSSGEVWCSDTMAEIVGRPANRSLSETDLWSLVHPDDRPRVRERACAALSAGADGRWEERFRLIHAATGATLTVDCAARAMRNDTGQPVRLLGTVREITARPGQA